MKSPRIVDILLVVLATAAVTIAAMSYLRSVRGSAPPLTLTARSQELIGKVLPRLPVLSTNGGASFAIDSSTASTVVLVFRSSCPFCERNSPNWRSLTDALAGRARVIAVSAEPIDSARAWLRTHGLKVDSLLIPANPADLSAWYVPGVPLTLVTDRHARITYAKLGVLSTEDRRTVVETVVLASQ